ncbi:MAG: hypothetical protein LBN31_13400 [Hungatella sp.]|jgi:leucyl aminopeptidase (aminopeptidase T)|uniref:hypothetical protein n=1 Tax=Lacrimispora sp. TaxID=2719234 RepID=UPI00281AA6E3|nr:hypothetical protein [Lacrimispora sp.]MDR0925333.1 hypothetical protein [Hungatella sp.]
MRKDDIKIIKGMVMEFIDLSFDDLETVKSIISKDLEHEEAVQYCAIKLVDLTIRIKKELAVTDSGKKDFLAC